MAMNPLYPIQVEGWRGAVHQDELESLNPYHIEELIESAYSREATPAGPWHPTTDSFEQLT